MEKSERHEFCLSEISRCQTSASRIKFASKGYSQSKTEKVKKTEHWILHIQIGLGTKFQLKLTILVFLSKFAEKEYFQSKSEKMNTTIKFCILKSVYILNFSLGWQFHFFWPNLPNKVFPVKTWKLNYTIEFCTSELVLVPNFSLNWQCRFFGPNLPKKGFSSLNRKKWTPTLNSAYLNEST